MPRAAGAEQERARRRRPRSSSTLRRSGVRSRYTSRMLEKSLMPDGRERLDRPRRNRVDADVVRPEIARQVAHRRFERRLGDAHHVVVGEDALAAEIGQRQHAAAAALLHQRHDRARQPDQRVRADVERDAEPFARRLHERDCPAPPSARTPRRARRKSRPPNSASSAAASVGDLLIARHVARQDERTARASRPARGRSLRAARSDTSARAARRPRPPPGRWPTRSTACWRRRR